MSRSLRSPGHLKLIKLLAKCRKEADLTQKELADSLSRPQSFIAKVETGERRLDVVEFIEICIALDVRPAVLLSPVEEAILETG